MIEVHNLVGGKFVKLQETFDDAPLNDEIIATVPRTKDADDAKIAAESVLDSGQN